MSSMHYYLLVIVSLTIMMFITRALPFMIGGILQHNQRIKTIGAFLPAYMMLLLTIFEINPASFTYSPYALPALCALALLTVAHLQFRQVLLSLITGTAAYLFFNWVFHALF